MRKYKKWRSTMEATGQIKVDSEDIFPIIKKWLYSEPDIFIRELVANATDAITKREILARSSNKELPEPRITIRIEGNCISFTDTGLGMTKDEVEKYITRVAFSGAAEFIKQMEASKDAEIIGKFGLGFYSAFMVATKVELDTLSYLENSTAIKWTCEGTTNYTFSDSDYNEVGTKITLHIGDDGKSFLDKSKLKENLSKYCGFMPYPIYLEDELINDTSPLWHKSTKELTDDDYIKFFEKLYPFEEKPLFWIHLKVDHPFTLEGILYFPKVDLTRPFKDSNIKLYCRQVFVSNDVKKIIPDFLSLLKGAIDSPDIPLNVSRSSLQGDPNIEKITNYVVKKVAEELKKLFKNDRPKYESIFGSLAVFVKYGIISNDKFAHQMENYILFKTSDDKMVTLDELKADECRLNDAIIYYDSSQNHLKTELQNLGKKAIETDNYIDPHVLQHLEVHSKLKFISIDNAMSGLSQESKPEDMELKDVFKNALGDVELEVNNIPSLSYAAYIKEDEHMRRFAQMTKALNNNSATLPIKKTLVINPSHPLLKNILKLKTPELSKDLCNYVYDMAMLTTSDISSEKRDVFIKNGQELLVKLTNNL